MCPAAEGILIRVRMCQGEAEKACIRSSRAGLVCFRPTAVLMNIGKKHTSATITTLDSSPKPNHTMISGASATLGIDCRATTYGSSVCSTARDSANRHPSMKASVQPRM